MILIRYRFFLRIRCNPEEKKREISMKVQLNEWKLNRKIISLYRFDSKLKKQTSNELWFRFRDVYFFLKKGEISIKVQLNEWKLNRKITSLHRFDSKFKKTNKQWTLISIPRCLFFFKERRNFNKSTTQRVEIESKNNLTSSIRFEI